MKSKKITLLLTLTVLCLLVIGGVVTNGILRNRLRRATRKDSGLEVLGEATHEDINQFVQGTLQGAKEKVVEKVKEAEKTILETINKEVENLTQSQVEALKLQICRDLGVITIAPTKNP